MYRASTNSTYVRNIVSKFGVFDSQEGVKMMTFMLVVRENYISIVISHSAAFHYVPIGETL